MRKPEIWWIWIIVSDTVCSERLRSKSDDKLWLKWPHQIRLKRKHQNVPETLEDKMQSDTKKGKEGQVISTKTLCWWSADGGSEGRGQRSGQWLTGCQDQEIKEQNSHNETHYNHQADWIRRAHTHRFIHSQTLQHCGTAEPLGQVGYGYFFYILIGRHSSVLQK